MQDAKKTKKTFGLAVEYTTIKADPDKEWLAKLEASSPEEKKRILEAMALEVEAASRPIPN